MSDKELTTVEQAQEIGSFYSGTGKLSIDSKLTPSKLAQDYIKVLAQVDVLNDAVVELCKLHKDERATLKSERDQLRSQVEALTADKDRLDKLLAQGIYLAHMSRKLNDRAHIDAHLSKLADARSGEKERE